jgi:hypothetical protein
MSMPHRASVGVRSLLVAGLLLAACAAGAQTAGEVEFSRGVGFAQAPGQAPRTLGRGLELKEGDRLTTAEGGSAIIKLQDGTRMTVRPNTEMVLTQYRFRENASDNSMLMQLVRGGFRAITGLINKTSPNAARIQTSTATIGIRGTDFDARICQAGECARESQQVNAQARPNVVLASAKLALVNGEVFAVNTAGQRHYLAQGGSVYPGDVVETMPGARAVLAFRDESRVTVGPNSRFRVDNFVYDDKNAGEGRFLASLLRGSVRALTGLIAKANNRNVGFSTATATIGIRGTGFDAVCADENCNGVTLWTWLGSIEVTKQGDTALSLLNAGQGLFISPQGIQPVFDAPAMDGPRPDGVNVDPKLFSTQQVSDAQDGLFVYVRDGHVEIATASQVLELGRGEAGYAAPDGDTERPMLVPKFIDFDKMPLPSAKNALLVEVLNEAGIKQQNQCK